MKTIWALAGALCLAARFAQAAPTADVVQDVGNGVNQISEKSAEAAILSSEVGVDVVTPFLVSRVSTILTAATPAIYQDAAKNPNELSERIVKPVTLLLNSVSGGVTTLAKDNSRRFFVPSFVRFNFRQDALLELDRIRRTERFWNETEQYVDSVCARLKKYIEVQRRRGAHGAPAPSSTTVTTPSPTPTVAPSAAPTSIAAAPQTKPSPTAFHVGVNTDIKLSIQESAAPIKVPSVDLPGKRNPLKPILRPRPTPEPHATVQTAPLKEPVAEVIAPRPIKPVESIESTSAAPSEVPVEATSVPSSVAPSSTSTQGAPETTTVAEPVVTTESVRSVPVTEQSTPFPEVPKVPSVVDVKVPEELVAAESVPAKSIVVPAPALVPAVESRSAVVSQPEPVPVVVPKTEPVPVVVSKTEPVPEPVVPVEAKTVEVPQADIGATVADSHSPVTPIAIPEEKSSPVTSALAEPSVAVVPQPETAASEVVPTVEVKTAEVPRGPSTIAPLSSGPIESAIAAPVVVKPVEVTPAVVPTFVIPPDPIIISEERTVAKTVSPVEVTATPVAAVPVVTKVAEPKQPEVTADSVVAPTLAAASPVVPDPVVVPAAETASPVAPKVVIPTTAVPETVETSSPSTVVPNVQTSTTVPQLSFTSSVAKPVPEVVPTPALPEVSAAESSVVPVTVQTPFPEVAVPTETATKTEPIVIPSTESAIVEGPTAGTTKPVEESYSTVSQDVTTVQQSTVTTAEPATAEVHRVHPVTTSIVFPTKASSKISQSVNVQQFGVSSTSSHENPLTYVSSTTVTTSRSDSSKSTMEALRFEQVALSHPIVIRPVKSPLPIAIPHRVIKHSSDGVSVVRTQSTSTIG